MVDGRFLFFDARSSAEVYLRTLPPQGHYGRGSKALWRLRGNLAACTRGVRGQLFSTPLYIYIDCVLKYDTMSSSFVK